MRIIPLSLLAAASIMTLICTGNQSARADDDDDSDFEIKGLITNLSGTCPNLTFTVKGARATAHVTTHAGTEFDDGFCAGLRNGRRVEVDGALQPNGSVIAHEVDLSP